ncbi:hypothetical protein ACJX0J_040906, partial [Zea mays]
AGEQGTESYHYFNTKNYMFRKCAQTHEDLRSESATDYFAIHNCCCWSVPIGAMFYFEPNNDIDMDLPTQLRNPGSSSLQRTTDQIKEQLAQHVKMEAVACNTKFYSLDEDAREFGD